MKLTTTFSFGMILSALGSVAWAAPVKTTAPVDRLFIPEGFDDNDKVEVVLYGEFPSSCYRIDGVDVAMNAQTGRYEINASALRYDGEICAQVITPYIKPVELGILSAGTYDAVAKGNESTLAQFEVAPRRTESPDDFIYAPVTTASVSWEAGSGKQLLNLKGNYPLTLVGCAILDDVKIHVTKDDVVVVQPIMEFIDDERCDQRTDLSFDESFVMPQAFVGKGLLHVRVMNGNSLNSLLDISR
jgi:hypothetical protein